MIGDGAWEVGFLGVQVYDRSWVAIELVVSFCLTGKYIVVVMRNLPYVRT